MVSPVSQNVGKRRGFALLSSVLWIPNPRVCVCVCAAREVARRLKVAVANVPKVPRLSDETGFTMGLRIC